MKIFLDEMINGYYEFFGLLGYEVDSVKTQKMAGYTDLHVIEYVRDNSYDVFITRDGKAHELAQMAGIRSLLITNRLVVQAIHKEIQSSDTSTREK